MEGRREGRIPLKTLNHTKHVFNKNDILNQWTREKAACEFLCLRLRKPSTGNGKFPYENCCSKSEGNKTRKSGGEQKNSSPCRPCKVHVNIYAQQQRCAHTEHIAVVLLKRVLGAFENWAYEKLLITELTFILMEIGMKFLSELSEALIWEGVGREFGGVLSFPI